MTIVSMIFSGALLSVCSVFWEYWWVYVTLNPKPWADRKSTSCSAEGLGSTLAAAKPKTPNP